MHQGTVQLRDLISTLQQSDCAPADQGHRYAQAFRMYHRSAFILRGPVRNQCRLDGRHDRAKKASIPCSLGIYSSLTPGVRGIRRQPPTNIRRLDSLLTKIGLSPPSGDLYNAGDRRTSARPESCTMAHVPSKWDLVLTVVRIMVLVILK